MGEGRSPFDPRPQLGPHFHAPPRPPRWPLFDGFLLWVGCRGTGGATQVCCSSSCVPEPHQDGTCTSDLLLAAAAAATAFPAGQQPHWLTIGRARNIIQPAARHCKSRCILEGTCRIPLQVTRARSTSDACDHLPASRSCSRSSGLWAVGCGLCVIDTAVGQITHKLTDRPDNGKPHR